MDLITTTTTGTQNSLQRTDTGYIRYLDKGNRTHRSQWKHIPLYTDRMTMDTTLSNLSVSRNPLLVDFECLETYLFPVL